ncbi:MAG: hypothetical protein AAGG44_06905 [Planctomycetota bacterium]
MSGLRFGLGDFVMCNLGASGWKLGRIIALHYRESEWPAGRVAPYQVAIEEDHGLVYVPVDVDDYCRGPTPEDLRISRRLDALANLPVEKKNNVNAESSGLSAEHKRQSTGTGLGCIDNTERRWCFGYRDGQCYGCDSCPRNWSSVELYSEHYRCAERNGLKVTHHAVDLGTVRVGDSIQLPDAESLPSQIGFMQSPTLVRLPPGIRFSDEGKLTGEVLFDPHRDGTYKVEFVAVSTAYWDDPAVGVVRLEITFVVVGNQPPSEFDVAEFEQEQQRANAIANEIYCDLGYTWDRWERGELDNRDTCEQMCADLGRLRDLLEQYPRLDDGRWWAQLGGYHMNVHKLLENTLFECELYLGHALMFGDSEVRWLAEQNLKGCYQKRLLEAARFMWIDGLEQMMRGEWAAAVETLRLAATKRDGWGWAVNFGDIWFSESAACLVRGATLVAGGASESGEGATLIDEAEQLLKRGVARTAEAGYFGPEGHPWGCEIGEALKSYRRLSDNRVDTSEWLEQFKLRTTYSCAQVLGGAPPFPPTVRPRRVDASVLEQRLKRLSN